MYRLVFFILLALTFGVNAQNDPIDFEAGGNGAGWTWSVFENDTNPPLEIIVNPDMSGANTSATVAKFTALQAGQPFAGVESMKGADIGTFVLDNTNSVIKIKVWKSVISDVGIKLVRPDFGALPEIKIANTLTNQWEEITFDFSAQEGFTYDQIVVFPDFNARTSTNVVYFDDITFNAQPVVGPNVPIDFEAGGNGATWTWAVFENDTNPPLEIIPNPDMTGANTSATVAKFTALQAGQPFAGTESMKGADIGTFVLDASNSLIKIKVWKPVISDVGIKLVRPDFGALPEIKVANTVVNQWEELTFDFSAQEGFTYDQIVIFPDFNARTQTNVCYFDDITLNAQVVATGPQVSAPAPTNNPADVISLYSNVFTDVTVDTWRTPWSAATLTDTTVNGDDTKLYTDLNFVGIETVGPNLIDASAMDNFNIDIWTPNLTTFRVKLVDFGADMAFGGGDDTEHEVVFNNPAQNTWVSYEIPLSDFVGLLNRDHIAQLILSGIPAGAGTVWVDNVYFSKSTGPIPGPNVPIDFEAGGNGANWTWTVFENDTNPPLEIIPNPDVSGANTSATVAKFTALQTGMPFAGVESMKGADIGTFVLDSTNSVIKILVWKPVISDVGIKLVRPDFGALPEIKVANTVVNQWEELTFDFSAQEGFTYDQIVIFPDFNARTSTNVCYFDNISLNAQTVSGVPLTAAPDPTEAPADVISLFSNSYTNVPVDTWLTPWSAGNLADIQIDGNDTKLYTNLNFVGVETVGPNLVDASSMDFFHLDIWTPNLTTFRVKLVDFGADMAFGGGDDSEHEIIFNNPAQEQWISYQIPLTDFVGLTSTSNLAQYIFSGVPAGAGTVYIDNVYFSKDACATPTNASALSSSTKAFFSWDAVAGATSYELMGGRVGFPPVTISVSGTSYLAQNLTPSSCYYWTVKAVCDTNTVSAPTAMDTICTADPCQVPQNPQAVNITNTTVQFTWGQVPGAVGYKIAVAPSPNPTNTVFFKTVPASASSYTLQQLTPCTTYKWRILTNCQFEASPFSPIFTFTTTGCPAKNEGTSASMLGDMVIDLYPNPASDAVIVSIDNAEYEEVTIDLADLTGRIISTSTLTTSTGNQIRLNTSDLPNGVYQVLITNGPNTTARKVVIAK